MKGKQLIKSQNDQENLYEKQITQNDLIVNQKEGPYKTIQAAINVAKQNQTILIYPGLYIENLIITTPGLTLKGQSQNTDIFIITMLQPCIYIALEKNCKVTFYNLKIGHSGLNEDSNQDSDNKEKFNINTILKQIKKEENWKNLNPFEELINIYPIQNSMNCGIYLDSGHLILENCLVTEKCIVKNNQQLIPCIVANEDTKLEILNSEIQGNLGHESIGILSRWADIIIKNSRIYEHINGGMQILSHVENQIIIINCQFYNNSLFGIYLVGELAKPNLIKNRIENNQGTGIIVGIGNKALIKKNVIINNKNGIQTFSSHPIIILNKINNNQQNGILTISYNKLINQTQILRNMIINNQENGIECLGSKNNTQIHLENIIAFNKFSGIKGDQEAILSIRNNNISRNCIFQILQGKQGILFVESSSGTIEKNIIQENCEANIAFGGSNSQNIYIIENRILRGHSQGIYMVDAGETWIKRNQILYNLEGIFSQKSTPIIENNEILYNKQNGITICKGSNCILKNNQIENNNQIGLYIVDKSTAEMSRNQINSNEIEFYLEKGENFQQSIFQNNTIDGDIRIDKKNICNIY